jgi:cytochrome c-type biogenesis protein CcmH/NrfG
MNKENILFSLVGIGFGLFFGFVFVTWANQKAQTKPRAASTDVSQKTSDGRASTAESEAAIKRAKENPNDFDAQMQGARAYYETQRFDDAIQLLLRANDLQQNNVEPIIALGDVNADAGNYKSAEKWYAAALEMKPEDANVRASLARVFLISTPPNYEHAVAELRRALKTDPRNEPSLQYLAFALAHQHDERGARDAISQLEKINPSNPAIPRLRQEIESNATSGNSNASSDGAH